MCATEVRHTDGQVQQTDACPRITQESFFGESAMHECMHGQNYKRASFTIAHGDLPI